MIESKISVEYKDHMGSDKSVVNAARVSFDQDGGSGYFSDITEKDEKLIRFLARENHWSPFAHTSVTLKCRVPIFIARQLAKHQVGGSWNEVSRRYISSEPEFWFPDIYRAKADNVKQGSSADPVQHNMVANDITRRSVQKSLETYNELLKMGVAPEQARMTLPLNTMTGWYWTGSIMFFARVCKQRLDPHAQKEAQEFAQLTKDIIQPLFPVSWAALMEN